MNYELVLLETFFWVFLFFLSFFLDLSGYKEFVIDCVFYILKLNLITFFGTATISASTKNKLVIIIIIII